MEKGAGKYFFTLSVIVLIIAVGIYAFTQALQLPLDKVNAEKVLAAAEIMNGERPLSGWGFRLPELPFYLLCVKFFGPGTYASIGVNVIFFVLLYTAGILILRARGLLNYANILLWTALCGLPDPSWLKAIQTAPVLNLALLMLPHFLAVFFEERPREHHWRNFLYLAVSSLCALLAVYSFPFLIEKKGTSYAVHDTIRALQTVFRADFSRQPLLNLATGRYFLMTIVMLLMILAAGRTVWQFFAEKNKNKSACLYSIFIILTVVFCCLPFSGDRNEKIVVLSWLPFGTALLLIFMRKDFENLRFAQGRISFNTPVNIFAMLLLIFGISPIVLSRPASAADRVVLYLNEQGFHHGYCEEQDRAVLSVAAKRKILFSTDENDPTNEFLIISSENDSRPNSEEDAVKIEKFTLYRTK